MTILALDMGTETGWAIQTAAGVSSGVQQFAKRKHDGDGDRLLRLYGWLTSMKGDGFTLVVYEQPRGVFVNKRGGLHAQHLFPQFEAILLLWCARHETPCRPVNPSTLKKNATGSGLADKEAVIRGVRELGHKPEDHNEADALALLLTTTGALKGVPPAKKKRPPKPKQAAPPSRELFDHKPF